MTRIVIAGGPRTGKTSLAGRLGRTEIPLVLEPDHPPVCMPGPSFPDVRHTDDLIHLGWSEASAAAALWLDAPGPWIVEGVAAVRALRKWLAGHPEGRPCDVVYWLIEPVVPVTPGQAAMARGCATVWNEIRDALQSRGVGIRRG